MGDQNDGNPAVAIVGIVAGVSLAVVVMFLVFAPNRIGVAGLTVAALALMGTIVASLVGRRK